MRVENKSQKIKGEKKDKEGSGQNGLPLGVARAGMQPWVIMKKTLVISVC